MTTAPSQSSKLFIARSPKNRIFGTKNRSVAHGPQTTGTWNCVPNDKQGGISTGRRWIIDLRERMRRRLLHEFVPQRSSHVANLRGNADD